MDFKERDAIEGYREFHAHEVPTVEEPKEKAHISNMRLMLAAPDLLRSVLALKVVVETIQDKLTGPLPGKTQDVLQQAQDVLDKVGW